MMRKVVAFMLILAATAALSAQAGGEWLQPYQGQTSGYWELIGRIVPDTPEARRDRAFRGFLEPSVLAAGSIKPNTMPGEIFATFVRFLAVTSENALNSRLPPERLVTADVTQVLFGVAAGDRLFLEVRTGNPSSEFQQCADARHQRFAHLLDIRLQATMLCEGALFWTSWRRSEVPLTGDAEGVMHLDGLGTIAVHFTRTSATLSGTISAP